jgi:D-alanyl-D-alanine carboxypeptidase (penicillin-binding protein 5/6)
MLVSLTIVLAEPRTCNARSVARRATAETAAPAGGEVYRSAIVLDADSGAVLFEKDAHRQNPPASMTKMMLMLIVAERVRDGSLHWDDPITTSAWASKIGGSQVYLAEGEQFPLRDLLASIMIASANDAAVAVARRLTGLLETGRGVSALGDDGGDRHPLGQ